MDTLILVAVGAAILWFLISGTYRTRMQDAETLRPEQLEDSIIELKKKILVTSAYDAEREYQRLYYRLKELMGQVLERHKHYVLDVEAMSDRTKRAAFSPSEHYDAQGMTYSTQGLPNDLDPSKYDPAFLIYACFFLWHGGQAKDVGTVEANPDLVTRILEYLIEEKSYGPAIFFKGMVKKYGKKVYSECYPEEARQLLQRSQAVGVGSAAIELEHLHKYRVLEGIKSVQLGA